MKRNSMTFANSKKLMLSILLVVPGAVVAFGEVPTAQARVTPPTSLQHTAVTQTGWTESWTPAVIPSGVPVNGYDIFVNGVKINSQRISGTSYTVTGENPGTTYSVKVEEYFNGITSATSSADSVTTLAAPVNAATPSISTQPQGTTVNEGATSPSLSVTASVSDSGTLRYQWYSNTSNSTSSGTAINGATSASYSVPTTSAGTTYYYVVVTNTNSSVNGTQTETATSSIAKVTVNALVNAATPSISTQPQGNTVNEDATSPSLSVTASVSDSGTLSYQWYSNTTNSTSGGTAISGATSASYNAPTTSAGTTYYYVVVTNTNSSVNGTQTETATSNVAKVIVNALVNAATPSISTQPQGTTVNEGATSPSPSLSVTASVSDSGTLSYQWYSNTTNSTSGGTAISGATSASYSVPTTSAGTTYYYVVVTNTNSSVNGTQTETATSSIAKVVVQSSSLTLSTTKTIIPAGSTLTVEGNLYVQNGNATSPVANATITLNGPSGGSWSSGGQSTVSTVYSVYSNQQGNFSVEPMPKLNFCRYNREIKHRISLLYFVKGNQKSERICSKPFNAQYCSLN